MFKEIFFCVREDHARGGEAINTLVRIDLASGGAGVVLASGNDFYSSPRLSPDGGIYQKIGYRPICDVQDWLFK
jgi:hypothetical protein